MRFYTIFFILISGFTMKAQSSIDKLLNRYNDEDISYISAEELKMKQLNDKIVILDARELEEYQVSHLLKSRFVGYNNFDLDNLKDLSKDAPIAVYCSLGIRSEDIAQKLRQAGYRNVFNLYGGIFQWKDKGFPVFDQNGKKTEKVHAYSEKWAKYLQNAEKIY